jgi:CheY-like chemotaxis protein
VNQILTFSRQKKQEKKPVKVNLIVKEVLKLVQPFIKTGIELRRNIQKKPAVVMCDPSQFHQVVMNLCTNAAQAMEEAGGRLEINLANIDVDENSANRCIDLKPGPYVRLSITDTGKGMDKNTMERIFEPYFTTRSEGKGTGLGLSVVHCIVKNLDGAIKVYSEPGKGTTFQVYFPRMEIEIRQDLETGKCIPRGTEHILLVDDESDVLELTEEILEDLGYTVTTRISGTEALKIFRENPDTFDLLITDLTMPEMNGKELAVQVSEIRPGFPMILCTGFSTEMTKEEESPKVIHAYINKPILIQEIAETIRRILDADKAN